MRHCLLIRKFVAVFAAITVLLLTISCSSGANVQYYSPYDHDFGTVVRAEIDVENYGTIELELYPDVAYATVENFVNLANEGFYDGLTFHRVVARFVIQGGDPTGTGYGLEGQAKITGEFVANGYDNTISHVRGVISMARSDASYNSATSQFFIVVEDQTEEDYLNGNYAAFGCVKTGMNIVDAISKVEVAETSAKPVDDVVITTIRILDEMPDKPEKS